VDGAGAFGRARPLVTALILPIPLLGNHFVDGWNWPPAAFVVVGTLLFGIGFTYELVTRNRDAIAYRAAVGIAFPSLFLGYGYPELFRRVYLRFRDARNA